MTSAILPPLPVQPPGVDWPTLSWSRGPLPPSVDAERLARLIDHGFTDFEETHAVVVVQGGRLVLDRYGPAHGPEATCLSWSMAKSITHALVGIAVGDGLLDIMAPAPVPEWRSPGDPRGAITTDQLLRMSSGLRFSEVYEPDKPSDTIEMMWGSGKADVAGLRGEAFAAFMRERLFEPLGMRTPVPKFDPAGTFIGSSFCFASGQDFARFGLLYLRDGVWNGRRLLPEGWVDYARTQTFQQAGVTDDPYGAHWWLGLGGEGSFSANGHEGQFTLLAPDLDLIIVRHGRTGAALKDALKVWMGEMAAAFRT